MNAAHGSCQPISPGAPAQAEPRHSFSALESTPCSLKFTPRLLTQSTWQACTQANSQPHTTSCCCLDRGLESHCLCIYNQASWGRADPWTDAFLSVGSLTSELYWHRSVRWQLHLACCVFDLLVNPCVPNARVFQISTWSPSRAPPFPARNWWPDYAFYWEKSRPALAPLWRTGGKRR